MLSFNRAMHLNDDDDTIDSLALQNQDSCALSDGHFFIPETPSCELQAAGSASAGGGQSVHDVMRHAGISLSSDFAQGPSHASGGLAQDPSQARVQRAPSMKDLYPHVTRRTDNDFDAYAVIDWSRCTSDQIYDICTSSHMMSGLTKSMAWVLNFAVKELTGKLSCFCPHHANEVKTLTKKGTIKPSATLKAAIGKCCDSTGVLHSLQQSLTAYTSLKANTVRFKPGAFPEVCVVSFLVFQKEPVINSR